MQQPIHQQDQLGGQQQMAQQQMMLCPVRLVYETPMLYQQSGDQMHQNQTIVINPQNPPPWARPVQNQVIYLHQLPNNALQQIPIQHLDTNQIYVQNFPNYQQVIPHHMLSQNPQDHQMRTVSMQIPNILPTNLIQNVHTNVGQNILQANTGQNIVQNNAGQNVVQPNASQGMVQNNSGQNIVQNSVGQHILQSNAGQNIAQISAGQNINPNIQNVPNERTMGQPVANYGQMLPNSNINIPNVAQNHLPVSNNRNIMTDFQAPQILNHNTQKAMEMQRQTLYRHTGPQSQQNTRPAIPPLMPMNQLPNQNVHQLGTNIGQTYAANIRHNVPIQASNVVVNAPQNIQQTNAMVNSQTQTARKPATANTVNNSSLNTVTHSAIRNGQSYTYRAIQPKPPQYRNVNFSPMTVQPQSIINRQQVPQNIQHANFNHLNSSNNINVPNSNTNIPGTNTNLNVSNSNNNLNVPSSTAQTPAFSYMKTENNINRKRKSESPDEIKKKIPVTSTVHGSMTITAKLQDNFKSKNVSTSNDVGVNTSPVHKFKDKNVLNHNPVLHIKPMEIPYGPKIKEETNNITQQSQQSIKMEVEPPEHLKHNVQDAIMQTDKDKLVRNTVFTQARGRMLNDKQTFQNNLVAAEDLSNKFVKSEENSTNIVTTNEAAIQTNKNKVVKYNIKPENLEHLKTSQNIIGYAIKLEKKENLTKVDVCKSESPENVNENIKPNIPILQTVNSPLKTNDTSILSNENILATNQSTLQVNEDNLKINETILKTNTTSKAIDAILKVDEPTLETKEANLNKTDKLSNEEVKDESEQSTDVTKSIIDEIKERKEYKNLSQNDMKGVEIHIVDGNIVKEDKDFLLTHVLDGYVIQESNIPFAIRKPLIEKTIFPNTHLEQPNKDDETLSVKDNTVKEKEKVIKDNSKIMDLSHLRLNEGKVEAKEEAIEDCKEKIVEGANPFADLKRKVVQTWTIEDLSSHLSKYNWAETISILREHELDGESLFLVSKPQLVTIGVSEEHADVIYEFVKS